MVWQEIVSAVCICCSSVIFSSSLQMHSKNKTLVVQMFASILYIANFLFVVKIIPSALIGAITAFVEVLRLFVFFFIEKSQKINKAKWNLISAISFCVLMVVCVVISWNGWVCILPLIGSILVTLSLGCQNMILIKLAYILQAVCIVTYLLILELWINAGSQVFVFVLGVVGLITFIVKNKKEKVNKTVN